MRDFAKELQDAQKGITPELIENANQALDQMLKDDSSEFRDGFHSGIVCIMALVRIEGCNMSPTLRAIAYASADRLPAVATPQDKL